jgi:hypothetical protein
MSVSYRRHVISEFVHLHIMEVYAPFILNVPVTSLLENVLSAPTEYEAGWISGPF